MGSQSRFYGLGSTPMTSKARRARPRCVAHHDIHPAALPPIDKCAERRDELLVRAAQLGLNSEGMDIAADKHVQQVIAGTFGRRLADLCDPRNALEVQERYAEVQLTLEVDRCPEPKPIHLAISKAQRGGKVSEKQRTNLEDESKRLELALVITQPTRTAYLQGPIHAAAQQRLLRRKVAEAQADVLIEASAYAHVVDMANKHNPYKCVLRGPFAQCTLSRSFAAQIKGLSRLPNASTTNFTSSGYGGARSMAMLKSAPAKKRLPCATRLRCRRHGKPQWGRTICRWRC